MLVCNIEITIFPYDGDRIVLSSVHSCEVFKSADVLLDSCSFVVPLRKFYTEKLKVPELERSYVEVRMGYDDNLQPVFNGYIMYIQIDKCVTVWCSGELAKYKYIRLHENNMYGFSFPQLLKDQGIRENIVTSMRDKPGFFEIQEGTVFGLLEFLKRLHIHACLTSDENDDSLIVLSRGYAVGRDLGRRFSLGKNIIDFKDAVVRFDLADDIRYNADVLINKQLQCVDSEGKDRIVDAVIAVEWPEWRGRTIHMQFWGIDFDNDARAEAHDCALRNNIVRGRVELSRLITFGAEFVAPLEKISVDWLEDVSGSYIVVSNAISFGLNGIRQKIKMIACE